MLHNNKRMKVALRRLSNIPVNHKKVRTLIKSLGITPSIKDNCYDNAYIFFGDLKRELIYNEFFDNKETLFKAINEYIHWYNYEKSQLVLKNHTPIEYRNVA